MAKRLCAVSVDLDEIHHYRGLHGLPSREPGAHAVYDLALNRMDDLARQVDIPLTFFAVGQDLERPESAARLAALHDRGHRIENHSYRHRYDLTRLRPRDIDEDVVRAQGAIEAVCGRRPVGFRAPGYTLSAALLEVLETQGFSFDSSAFPCPSYFAAKTAVLAWMRLRGAASQAILTSPRAAVGPRIPHKPSETRGAPRGGGLLELPISVTRVLRLPFIGTSVTMAGPIGARMLARGCVDSPLVNLELHGIDVLDSDDGLSDLSAPQPDVRVPVARKLAALTAAIDELRVLGCRFVTLSQAAQELGARC